MNEVKCKNVVDLNGGGCAVSLYANRAEKAAEQAEETAKQVKDLIGSEVEKLTAGMVGSVTEENGVITVTKANGEQTTFKLIKSINKQLANDEGNFDIPIITNAEIDEILKK